MAVLAIIRPPPKPMARITKVVATPAKNTRALDAMAVSLQIRQRTHEPQLVFRTGKARQCKFERLTAARSAKPRRGLKCTNAFSMASSASNKASAHVSEMPVRVLVASRKAIQFQQILHLCDSLASLGARMTSLRSPLSPSLVNEENRPLKGRRSVSFCLSL